MLSMSVLWHPGCPLENDCKFRGQEGFSKPIKTCKLLKKMWGLKVRNLQNLEDGPRDGHRKTLAINPKRNPSLFASQDLNRSEKPGTEDLLSATRSRCIYLLRFHSLTDRFYRALLSVVLEKSFAFFCFWKLVHASCFQTASCMSFGKAEGYLHKVISLKHTNTATCICQGNVIPPSFGSPATWSAFTSMLTTCNPPLKAQKPVITSSGLPTRNSRASPTFPTTPYKNMSQAPLMDPNWIISSPSATHVVLKVLQFSKNSSQLWLAELSLVICWNAHQMAMLVGRWKAKTVKNLADC